MPSDWAQDIPDEAFVDAEPVATAPSAMDLYCMGRKRTQLEETLKWFGGIATWTNSQTAAAKQQAMATKLQNLKDLEA